MEHNKQDLLNKWWIFHNNEGKAHTGFTLVDDRTWQAISKEPIVELFDTEQEWQQRLKELDVNEILS